MTGDRVTSWHGWRQAASWRARMCRQDAANGRVSKEVSFGNILYCGLALAGWVSTTLFAAAGCMTMLLIMAGNGSLTGFFTQVGLLGQHYLAAASPARKAFDFDLLTAAGCLCVLTGFLRRGALIAIFRRGARDGQ